MSKEITTRKIIGILDFGNISLHINYIPKNYMGRQESVFEIHGDGCVMPYLNRSQVNNLLASIVAWLNIDDEEGGCDE